MTLTFSSTLPNAFDTRKIAAGKWLQSRTGGAAAITNTGTVTISPLTNSVFDTRTLTLEKFLGRANTGLPTAPVGFRLLVDGNGRYIKDGSGNYIIVPV